MRLRLISEAWGDEPKRRSRPLGADFWAVGYHDRQPARDRLSEIYKSRPLLSLPPLRDPDTGETFTVRVTKNADHFDDDEEPKYVVEVVGDRSGQNDRSTHDGYGKAKREAAAVHRALTRDGLTPVQMSEAISKTDFYDLYSLVVAYQEHRSGVNRHPRIDEITKRLRFELSYVIEDQLREMGEAIIDRWLTGTSDEQFQDGNWPVLMKHGIRVSLVDPGGEHLDGGDGGDFEDAMPKADVSGAGLDDMAAAMLELLALPDRGGFTGATWTVLLKRWVALARKFQSAGGDLNVMIQTVDRLHGMMHHGGWITDYMGAEWMPDALNDRALSDPGAVAARASRDVRQLVGYSGTARLPTAAAKRGVEVDRMRRRGRNPDWGAIEIFGDEAAGDKRPGDIATAMAYKPKYREEWDAF